MIRLAIGFDTETRPIQPGVQAPPAVSLQWSSIESDRLFPPNVMGGLGAYEQMLEVFHTWLLNPDLLLYGANTAYDMLCMCTLAARIYGYDAAQEMLTSVFAAYRASRVSDVLTRAKMLDLAAGCYRGYFNDKGKWQHYGYNLDDVHYRYTGRRLNKNVWELQYGKLEPLPIGQWPQGAVDYAREDGLATGQCTLEQTRYPRAIQQNFPGHDPLVDEFNQARAAFWLKLCSVWGIRTNGDAVSKFSVEVQNEYYRMANELADNRDPEGRQINPKPLVYREYKLNRAAIVKRVGDIGKMHLITKQGDLGESKITLAAEPLLQTGDQLLALAAVWRTLRPRIEEQEPQALRAFGMLRSEGLASCEFHRSTKAAAERMIQVCTSQNRNVKMTEKDGIALDKETCESSGDPWLQSYAEYSSLSKTMSNDIPALRSGTYYPIHTRFEELLDTGRTSSSNPNIQNVRRLVGMRECFRPRDGHIIIDADYKMLELYTLAQVCLWKLGYSSLADTLKRKFDPHLKVGATMLSLDYARAKQMYEANDGVVSNARDCGKVANFGIPGGLGAETLVMYAAKSYGVRITEDQAKEIKKFYFDTFIEMPEYFRYVHSLETYPESGSFNVVQPWSKRLRADATFCAACNSNFQGLGADVAKLAGWFVAEAMYVNKSDALFGCRMINFIHDQFLIEAKEDIANDAARSLAYHMDRAAAYILPDCPTYASVLTSRVWSKKAKRVEVEGKMIPWEPSKELVA